MLIKGIIFLLVFVLFISRLIPKYLDFTETRKVHLLGIIWEGNVGLLILFGIAVLAVVLLILGVKNIKDHFSSVHRRK